MMNPISITLKEIGAWLHGEVVGDDQTVISGAAPFESAIANEITYAFRPAFLRKISTTGAAAIIVPQNYSATEPGKTFVRVENPYAAFAKVLQHFYPPVHPESCIHPAAVVSSKSEVGDEPYIGAGATLEKGVVCGDRVKIYPGVYLGEGVQVGDDVVLHPNVTILKQCHVGSRVIIHAGTVIGSDGFGFAPDGEHYQKIPHSGIVVIEDDVEIGANTTIDRATFGETRIRNGVKIDNLVHIAHNVVVGEDTLLVAQAGIAGSTTIGKHVIIAGQAAVADHVTIGDGVIAAPRTGMAQSVAPGETVSGAPAIPHRLWLRVQRIIPRLPELAKRIKALEKKMSQ